MDAKKYKIGMIVFLRSVSEKGIFQTYTIGNIIDIVNCQILFMQLKWISTIDAETEIIYVEEAKEVPIKAINIAADQKKTEVENAFMEYKKINQED